MISREDIKQVCAPVVWFVVTSVVLLGTAVFLAGGFS